MIIVIKDLKDVKCTKQVHSTAYYLYKTQILHKITLYILYNIFGKIAFCRVR